MTIWLPKATVVSPSAPVNGNFIYNDNDSPIVENPTEERPFVNPWSETAVISPTTSISTAVGTSIWTTMSLRLDDDKNQSPIFQLGELFEVVDINTLQLNPSMSSLGGVYFEVVAQYVSVDNPTSLRIINVTDSSREIGIIRMPDGNNSNESACGTLCCIDETPVAGDDYEVQGISAANGTMYFAGMRMRAIK